MKTYLIKYSTIEGKKKFKHTNLLKGRNPLAVVLHEKKDKKGFNLEDIHVVE